MELEKRQRNKTKFQPRRIIALLTSILFITLFTTGSFVLQHYSDKKPGDKDNIFVNDPVNIFLLVGDKSDWNTDTMMVINFNPKDKRVSFLSLPRDTRVLFRNSSVKLNSVYSFGSNEDSTKVVSGLLGININYFVHVKIKTFTKVIDMLGGVDYNVPVNLYYKDPSQGLNINLKKGMQHLDGDKAEQLLRYRQPQHKWTYRSSKFLKYYDGSDTKRTERQLDFLRAFIKQKANLGYVPKFNEVINEVFKEVKTNITMREAFGLLGNIGMIDFKKSRTFRIDGDSATINGLSYYVYENKIYDPKKDKSYAAKKILPIYFKAYGNFIAIASEDSNYNPGNSWNNSPEPTSNKSTKIKKQTAKP